MWFIENQQKENGRVNKSCTRVGFLFLAKVVTLKKNI